MSFLHPSSLRRARQEEFAVIALGLALFALGIASLGFGRAIGLTWLLGLSVVGLGLVFMALISYVTFRDEVQEHERGPHDHASHSPAFWRRT